MKQNETKIEGCWLIEGKRFFDNRGFFQEMYSDRGLTKKPHWKQVNWSQSKPDVVRGVHVAPFQKLVTCVSGHIFDVVIDLRRESDTFYQWEGFELNGNTPSQVLIPPGCGHGFFARTLATVIYMQDDVYAAGKEKDWHWRSLPILWPRAREYVLSDKDKKAQPWQG